MSRLRIAIIVLIIGYVVYDRVGDASRDDTGDIVSAGELSVFSLRVGDCFNDSQEVLDADGNPVSLMDLEAVPCSEPHDNEVYAVFDLELKAFPGDDAVFEMAADECLGRFEGFVGLPYEKSILDIYPIYPTKESWLEQNDREVACAVYHMDLEKLTGSMEASGI